MKVITVARVRRLSDTIEMAYIKEITVATVVRLSDTTEKAYIISTPSIHEVEPSQGYSNKSIYHT